MSTALDTQKVKKAGWLIKEGGRWKSWKRRFFIFDQKTLSYYKDQLLMQQMGEIPVKLATCIEPVGKYKKHDFVFKIVTPSRTFYINCSDQNDLNDWIDCLKELSARVNVSLAKIPKQTVTEDDFEIISLVGKGAFGKVFLVKEKSTGTLYAMKVVTKKQVIEQNEVEHTLTEKNILAKVKHPFLVNLYYSFQTSSALHYVIDYCPGGELYALMQSSKTFKEQRAKFYAAQMVLAIEHLHNQGVIYRDIKPENIMVCEDGYIRLTDFGLSKTDVPDAAKTSTFCGTPEYLAPELVMNVPYTNSIDWWGLGILIYEMLFGAVPFFSEDIQELYRNILHKQVTFPANTEITLQCRDVIEHFLRKKPEERFGDVEQIKEHSWFSDINWEELFSKRIVAPYIPNLSSPTDLSCFNKSITSEDKKITGEAVSNEAFKDFTYINHEQQ
ncbi:hypothetical protein EIN_034610 [Entamoeba invadens IP1]|uniref:non-specific serine/threonine protein kinase n=1 Tax=Entamoeba invadens IP1 TaxID=370355 RepID=A0A0A1TYF7_ENTIV|nr:hypothetical protein EIN_034610 [Entamoeba invadens IP1]ELP86520.1 hypothetical protein EIN_034610 [Entamoeba invadens IP1]|eukprot:XP_004185866.1 hypothetical protein EIN_034610 [Entamoeba invadens IP1]